MGRRIRTPAGTDGGGMLMTTLASVIETTIAIAKIARPRPAVSVRRG
jgi:hypothetical protein